MVTAILLIGGAFAGVVVGKIWDRTDRYVSTVRPAGKLWGWLVAKEPVQIVMSTGLVHDNEYTHLVFPSEAEAAAEIKSYLGSALHLTVRQGLADGLGDNLRNDLVLIGGPVANEVSRRVLAMPQVPFRFDDHTIVHEPSGERWHATVEVRDGHTRVSADYCLIVRMQNPFNRSRGVLLIGGSRAYGTLAGARALLRGQVNETLKQVEGYGGHYMAMIETRVHNNVPGEPTIIKCWALPTVAEGASMDSAHGSLPSRLDPPGSS